MFRAENDEKSTLMLAMRRARYYTMAHGSVDGPVVVKHLNTAEKNYYGRINSQGFSIIPNLETVKTVTPVGRSDKTPMLANEILSDMFQKMRANAQCKLLFQQITAENDEISAMLPYRAFEDPYDRYSKYISRALTTFNRDYLPDEYGTTNITSFNDYVKALMIYFNEQYVNLPITLTAWNTSGYNSVFGSSLAVSVAGLDFQDDNKKQVFMESQLYSYYKLLALNAGFGIVKQAPHILVMELNSPAMERFYRNYDLTGINDFFGRYFTRTSDFDVQILRAKVFEYYNDFVTLNEVERTFKITCGKTIPEYTRRQNINSFNNIYYNSNNWYKMYINLRNIENNYIYNKHDMKTYEQKVIKLIKKFDISEAIGYIDRIFTPATFKRPFGFNDLQKRRKRRNRYNRAKQLQGNNAEPTSFVGASGGSGGSSTGGGGSGGGY